MINIIPQHFKVTSSTPILKGIGGNNFVYTLRMPKKWYYDCAAVGVNASDTVNCKMNLKTNQTFFT
jgi:hypothetical protein